MTEYTEDKLIEAVAAAKAVFDDGFQFSDLSALIEVATEFADLYSLTGDEKRALAIRLVERVIDETDTPWLPDPLVDPLLKEAVPSLIDLVVKAAKGKLKVNR